MIDLLTDPHIILSFITLAVLEIVLGIDNLLFVQLVAGRVQPKHRMFARRAGLALALLTRLALLASISWIASLTTPIWSVNWPAYGWSFDLSWRDIILLAGGLFLLAKATTPEQESCIGNQHGGRVGFFLHTDDFARDHARLTAAGAQFEESPRHEEYGTVVVFRDLYGNRWDLIEPRA